MAIDETALARIGAQAEIQQLETRLMELRAFLGAPDGQPAPKGKRRPMSAAARLAVSQRMKRYWAQRAKRKKAPTARGQ